MRGRLSRAWASRRAIATPPWARSRRGAADRRGRRARKAMRAILGAALDAPVRDVDARGGGRGGRGDDRGGRDRRLSRHERAASTRWVTPLLGERARAPTRRSRARYDAAVPGLRRGAPARSSRSGTVWQRGDGEHGYAQVADHRRPFHAAARSFEEEMREACGDAITTSARARSSPGRTSRWSTAMPTPAWRACKEYLGGADESSSFIGDAEILVTHLAPMSAAMLDAAAGPEADRGVARRPGQHRHGGGARARRRVVNTPGPQCLRRRRVHARRDPRRDAARSASATKRCAGASGAAISTAPTRRAANSAK